MAKKGGQLRENSCGASDAGFFGVGGDGVVGKGVTEGGWVECEGDEKKVHASEKRP